VYRVRASVNLRPRTPSSTATRKKRHTVVICVLCRNPRHLVADLTHIIYRHGTAVARVCIGRTYHAVAFCTETGSCYTVLRTILR